MKATLISNPASGLFWQAPKRLEQIRAHLSRHGIELHCVATAQFGDATRLARAAVQQGVDLVIAYGGDGTLNEVVAGLAGTDVPLGILPGGTANVLARELRIPSDIRGALEVLVADRRLRISLGRAGERYFNLMAGVGLDAAVVASMPPRLKRAMGVPSFWIQGFRELYRYPLRPFQVIASGRRFDATFAVIANAASYGGALTIAPLADVRSDKLDVCLFHSPFKSRYLFYLLAGFMGVHTRLPDVSYFQTGKLTVEGDPSIAVQVDGELAGRLPMQFHIVPECLTVLVPDTAAAPSALLAEPAMPFGETLPRRVASCVE